MEELKNKRRYGRAWKRIRDKFVKEHPYCQICGKPTEEIHHIIPISKGGTAERNNLMALCKECHANIHIEQRKKENEKDSKSC